ncbi:MAG: ribosome silencing factor [Planctomycetes bacterium]|nr:ribosome silencing factor [Planctomycetota bacterium]
MSEEGPQEKHTIDAITLAATAARLAEEKKAEGIEVIQVRDQLKVADYFVVCGALNRAHARAIQNELHVRLKAMGETHKPVEGMDVSWWIVLDYDDVVVHVLQPEAREFYDLEQLYGECPRIDWESIEVSA